MNMRSIETFEAKETRLKKRRVALSVILVVLMLGSTLGYAFSLFGRDTSTGNGNENKGLVYQNGLWTLTRDDGSVLVFSNSLEETRNVSVEINLGLYDYYQQPVFIVSNNSLADLEIGRIINTAANRMQKACYGACEEELPEKGCDEFLIIFNESDEKRVYQENKCIFIEGDMTSVDAFLYKIVDL